MLDKVLQIMAKTTKKRKKLKRKSLKKLGRPLELKQPQNLPRRFSEAKSFLEHHWGRLGPGLRTARDNEDIRKTLALVPNIEWMPPFRGHADCLIAMQSTEVSANVLRETRRKLEEITGRVDDLWTNFHNLSPNARQASAALVSVIAQFGKAITRFDFFFIISLLAAALKTRELTDQFHDVQRALNKAEEEKRILKETLQAQEAWFARNELVKFARNRRREKSLLNFARVIAGLPEWGWFHARRECEKIVDKSIPTPTYQIFELLVKITRRMKPLKLKNVENKLRTELLRDSTNAPLAAYIKPQWDYLVESIRFCEGQNFRRSEIPYKIMDRFLYHLERPKTGVEIELSKINQLH